MALVHHRHHGDVCCTFYCTMCVFQIQEVLINKMRELNAARESQISLKAEIGSFRSLIEEEERRLRISKGSFPELPVLPQGYRSEPTAGATAPTLVAPPLEGGSRAVAVNARGYMQSNPGMRPLGPIKSKSDVASTSSLRQHRTLNLISSNMGQGTDYCEEMYKDLKLSDSYKVCLIYHCMPAR